MRRPISVKPLVLAVAASQVMLYNSAPSFGQQLEEVVITARKRTETLMDAPVAVTAVSGQAMESRGITNMEQLSSTVPGLSVGRGAQTSCGQKIRPTPDINSLAAFSAANAFLHYHKLGLQFVYNL